MAEMWQKIRIGKLVLVVLVLIQVFVNLFALNADAAKQVVFMATSGVLLVLLSVYNMFFQRKNMLCLILNIVILYFNYSLVSSVYWSADSLPRVFATHTYNELLMGINIVLIFFYCVCVCVAGES